MCGSEKLPIGKKPKWPTGSQKPRIGKIIGHLHDGVIFNATTIILQVFAFLCKLALLLKNEKNSGRS